MMKRHLSVLMLAARNTAYKITGILLVMAAAEGVLFYAAFQSARALGPYGLELVITESRLALVCLAGFLGVCALLSLSGCELRGGRLGYTMKRLSIREETTAVWWAVYNVLVFLIFWAAQLAIALALCYLYTLKADPAYVSSQTVYLAFYRQKFLHSLLPLEETSRYLRNAVLAVGLGVTAACLPVRQRSGMRSVAVILLAALTAAVFPAEMGSFWNDLMLMLATLAVTAGAAVNLLEVRHAEN